MKEVLINLKGSLLGESAPSIQKPPFGGLREGLRSCSTWGQALRNIARKLIPALNFRQKSRFSSTVRCRPKAGFLADHLPVERRGCRRQSGCPKARPDLPEGKLVREFVALNFLNQLFRHFLDRLKGNRHANSPLQRFALRVATSPQRPGAAPLSKGRQQASPLPGPSLRARRTPPWGRRESGP